MVVSIVNRYGGEEYMAVDVRFSDGQHRLFWPEDLEMISFSQPWWRSLLGAGGAGDEGTQVPVINYDLDESDEPDILTLHGQDHSFIAAFSIDCITKERICEAVEEDYRELIQALSE